MSFNKYFSLSHELVFEKFLKEPHPLRIVLNMYEACVVITVFADDHTVIWHMTFWKLLMIVHIFFNDRHDFIIEQIS